MVGPVFRRGKKLVYHRGNDYYSTYSAARDARIRARTSMRHWPPKRKVAYRHTAD